MSGGHFDYRQFYFSEIAENIENIIYNKKSSEWEEDIEYHFSPEIIKKFKDAVKALKIAYVYVQHIDLLLSGDNSEKAFLKGLAKELGKVN